MSEKHQPCGKSGCLNCIPSTTSVMRTPEPILYIGEPLRQTQNPRTAKEVIQNMTDQDRKIIALEATVAQQAQMIEHLRGGPTPLFTAVDMGTAAADGRRSLAEHLIKQIAIEHPDQDTLLTVKHIAQWIALEAGL